MSQLSAEQIDKNFAPKLVEGDVEWYDALEIGLEGRGFSDTESPFDRLPARARALVREPVWNLSRHSTGIVCRFVTDATTINARWKIRLANRLEMPHMPSSGMSGLDLYTFLDGEWKWAGAGIPSEMENTRKVAADLLPGKREYLLYCPLYNSTESLQIGLPAGSTLSKPQSPPAGQHTVTGLGKKPIVFYGTSVTQGGCACRSGMGYVEILSRNLRHPTINLGFSGSGPMEPEIITLMTEIDAACYVLDNLPNMSAEEVTQRTVKSVEILRAAHPDTPILLIENFTYQNSYVKPYAPNPRNVNLRIEYKKILAKGIPEVYLLPGHNLMGNDGLGTVDGSHPTDLGFLRMAQTIGPAVQAVLK